MAEEKFLIQIRDSVTKPQQKTVVLDGEPWDIEWSTTSSVSMRIDSFNLTIARYKVSEENQKKTAEEWWRVTGIPGHVRKIRYGTNLPESTSTQPRVLRNGIYAIKISGMSIITEGLFAETSVGVALIKLVENSVPETTVKNVKNQSEPAKTETEDSESLPITITNEALKNLFALMEEDELNDTNKEK
jgi:hypothetical protein